MQTYEGRRVRLYAYLEVNKLNLQYVEVNKTHNAKVQH